MARLGVVLPSLLVACGGPAPPIVLDAGPRDAQVTSDGPARADAEPTDAESTDAESTDAEPTDAEASVSADAGDGADAGETSDAGGEPGVCRFDPATDLVELGTDVIAGLRPVSVAAGASSFAITWIQSVDGFGQVHVRIVPTSGATGTSRAITTRFATYERPVIESVGAAWLAAWYSNADADFDIYAQALAADGTPRGPEQAIGVRMGRDDNPALLRLASGVLAAWVETGPDEGARAAVTRLVSDTATPTAAARRATTPPPSATTLALARREGGVSLAFATTGSLQPDVVLVPLDATGAPAGAPVTLSTEHNADGTVDLAASDAGGAVAFGVLVDGVRHEVRARLLSPAGSPSGPERVVTPAPEAGRDASIARLGGGYLVSYRASDGGVTRIRVAMLSASLDVLRTLDVAEAEPNGGPTQIRVAGDGRALVAWMDDLGPSVGARMRAARIRCD